MCVHAWGSVGGREKEREETGVGSQLTLSLCMCKTSPGKETGPREGGTQAEPHSQEGNRLESQVGKDQGTLGRPSSVPAPEREGPICFCILEACRITGAQEAFIEKQRNENTLTRETEFKQDMEIRQVKQSLSQGQLCRHESHFDL